MDALVRKTEVVERQLGSAGQVIEERIKKRMADGFTNRAEAEALAKAIEDENDPELISRAQAEMDDGERARHERLLKEQEELRGALEQSRSRVGVSADDLTRVAGAALSRAGFALDSVRGETVGDVATFKLDPDNPAFAHESGWNDVFDDLRTRRRKRGEKLSEWRKNATIRPIVFEPPRMPDGRYLEEVVQVHLEHRLVRRLLSRFLSQGFQAGLSRFSVIEGPGAQPRQAFLYIEIEMPEPMPVQQAVANGHVNSEVGGVPQPLYAARF